MARWTWKTRFGVAGTMLVIVAALLLVCANYLPDQTWDELESLRSVYGGLTAGVQRPPALKPQRAPIPYRDADGYAVMGALKRYLAKQHVIVVREEIEPDPHLYGVPDQTCIPTALRERYGDALTDFRAKWPQPWLLQNRFSPASEFVVVPESLLPKYANRFAPANAAGYFAFSAVGFNARRDAAAIYVIHRAGHYGNAELLLMNKNNSGKWEIDGTGECGWIT